MAKELRFPRVNSIVISGRLTRDIELRYTQNNVPVAQLPIAFDRSYKDSSGNDQKVTSYIDVVVWQKLGERCAQYLHKGSAILVEGYLQTRSYMTRDNQPRKVVEIVAGRVHFLEKDTTYDNSGMGSHDTPPPPADNLVSDITEDDVPF